MKKLPQEPTLKEIAEALCEAVTALDDFTADFCPTEDDHKVHRKLCAALRQASRAAELVHSTLPEGEQFLWAEPVKQEVCSECKKELPEDYEEGAHGDRYCKPCYRALTSEKNHGF